jgi:DHA3 family macrolide efflux protein-like MFS transporter
LRRARLFTFYTLLITQTFSLIGSRMTAVAVGIWVFSETGLAAPLLLVSFFTELPGMLMGGLAGVLVDRWNRKAVLVLADTGQALGSLLLLISFQSGNFQLWHLYAISMLQGVFAAFQGPAEGATVTLLIPEGQRERANGIIELAFPLAGVLAPMLAGLVYGWVGVVGVLAIDLITFVFAAGVASLLAIPQPPPSEEGQAGRGKYLAELRGGLGFIKARPALLAFMLYLGFNNFLLNGPLDLIIPYSISITGSEAQTGLVLGLMSLGAFAGALLATAIGGWRPRMRLILVGTLFNGVMFLALAAGRSLPWLGFSILLLMIPLPLNNALYKSILQIKAPPDLQGRVFAIMNQLYLLGSTTSFLVVGYLVDRVVNPWAATAPMPWLEGLGLAGPAMGYSLVLFVTGLLVLLSAGLALGRRPIRTLEADLPDYAA